MHEKYKQKDVPYYLCNWQVCVYNLSFFIGKKGQVTYIHDDDDDDSVNRSTFNALISKIKSQQVFYSFANRGLPFNSIQSSLSIALKCMT